MSWFASALPVKSVCRFLLNRYLGEILLEKVSLEQLSVDVLNGTGSISDVNLDVQHINASLHKNAVPFELVDGFIGLIVVKIPYSKILEDSCTIEITGLELTLQPKPCKSTDLVTSMIDSVIGSMTTSMDLAKSFVEEQNNGVDAEEKFQGIDALAQIIQTILSRMKVTLINSIIRLEHFASPVSDVGIAVEVNIDKVEFVDEVVDSSSAVDETEIVTEQPQSSNGYINSSSQDVSKLVKLQGVRFFTDIFAKPEGALCKSVVFRRKTTTEFSTANGEMMGDSSVYKSCYSGGSRSVLLNGDMATFSNSTFCLPTPSKPVQFAQFLSEKLSLRVRLKNTGLNIEPFKHDEIDVEMFLGSLHVFLTPTQLYLLSEIASSLISSGNGYRESEASAFKSGKPMQAEDYVKVEMDLRRKIDEIRLPTSSFKPEGNWSGEDKFYRSSKTPWKSQPVEEDDSEFTSIPMSFVDESHSDFSQMPRIRQHSQSSFSTHDSSKVDVADHIKDKPETSRCKICFANVVVVLTHDDPFDVSSANAANVEAANTNILNNTTKFFEAAKRFSLSSACGLKDVRKVCDEAYDKNHLRLLSCPLVFEYTQHKQENMQICLNANRFEVLECLFDDTGVSTHVEMLVFTENDLTKDRPDVFVRFGTEDQRNYFCTIELNKCAIEVDVSLVDRLNNLLFCQPSFKINKSSRNRYLFEVPNGNTDLGLREDWFEPLSEKASTSMSCSVDILCDSYTIDLRIPIPDLRTTHVIDRSPWWIRRVRDERLRLTLEDTKFKAVICEDIAKLGSFAAEFSKGTVYFCESDKLEAVKLLHVFKTDSHSTCGFDFKWDFVNRSLFDDRLTDCPADHSTESLLNSLERNCFKISTNLDGPFSKKHVVHENEQLTIVGSESEMKDFRRKCLKYCEMGVHLRLPSCRAFLPGKELYELLYNRLVNDLSFWTPSSPGFQSSQHTTGAGDGYNVWATGFSGDTDHFAPCKSGHRVEESDSDGESTLKSSVLDSVNGKRKGPHRFSCLLQCGSLDLLTCLGEKVATSPKLRLQLQNGELFFVYGYENDENVSYFYITSETASLKHSPQNLNLVVVDEVITDVEVNEFARNQDWINTIEPTPPNLALKTVKDDNFSLAVRLVLHPKENVKEYLITFGVRDSTVHYRTVPADQFWLTQLISFFDVVDYPVLGFDPPKVINEIHVHAWNLAVQYKPEKLAYAVRCYVDSLDVSTNIVQESSMFRFHIILEDSSLFLTDKTARDVFYNLTIHDYVCLMKMGFFELILTNFEPPSGEENGRNRPFQEIHVHNDSLEIRTCADSFAALSAVVKYLVAGGDEIFDENSELIETNDEIISNKVNGVFNDFDSTDEKLRDLMASAMEETETPAPKPPPRTKTERSKTKSSRTSSRKPSSNSGGNDEEFLILDELPGTGIRSKSGEPRIRVLSSNPVNIVDSYIEPPAGRTDPLTVLPVGYPLPLLQYFLRDFSVTWHFYGGRDFGENNEQKVYSRMTDVQHTPKLRQRVNEARRNIFTAGGAFRDHSVHVEVYVNKMCLLYELYPPNYSQTARQIMTIQDFEIRDHLFVSSINKLLYRYTTEQKPKQTYLPMFCVKLLHFVPDSSEIQRDAESCLKVSILPLRLNIDQDTIQFLTDFGKDFNQTLNSIDSPLARRNRSSASLPVVKIPSVVDETQVGDIKTTTKRNSIEQTNFPLIRELSIEPPPPLNDFLFDDLQSTAESVKPIFDEGIIEIERKTVNISEEGDAATNGGDILSEDQCSIKSDIRRTSSQVSMGDSDYYFKSFVFSPAVEIKLDYHGKRLHMDQGALPGLLMGLSQLHATELRLKELHHRHGLLGFERVVTYAINEWLNDIRRNQVYNIVGGVGPVHTLVQVSQGIKDLFWLPVDQYRRDGHVVKGLQRGAQSFGVSTASAALELSQRLVGTVQGVAEFAFDIVNPEYPPRRNGDLLQGLLQPHDFREGVHMACATVRRGFCETAEAITLATQEEKARGRWAIRGVLRQATPTVLRPLVVASQATTHILGGLRNQLRPDTWREEQDKWKNE